MMTVADIIRICEQWAPSGAAWERDNVGLQIGNTTGRVRRILVALDITEAVVREAVKKKIDLVITHHPLFYRLPRSLTDTTSQGRIAREMIRNGIALYSMHTNLDRVRDGVSFALARTLGLQNISFLVPLEKSQMKIATFVPRTAVENVADAMSKAGAGVIGKYTECSFRTEGVGTYRPDSDTSPWAGTPGLLEKADEIRLEMVAARWNVPAVIAALLEAHPYEEVAYDVYPIENGSPNFGMGAIGTLSPSLSTKRFLNLVRKKIAREGFRYTAGRRSTITCVAVCGGSGTEYLTAAIVSGADAYVTADVSYHVFQEAENRITLIDAGHFETEHGIVGSIVSYLESACRTMKSTISIGTSRVRTNPIYYS
jgi:dinuclear metal center YbgI/SA1388 family protein